MHPYQISILGLFIDIIGAFFLAVEAIKVHNFRFLCDKVLKQIYHQARSPTITFGGDSSSEDVPREHGEVVVNWASRHDIVFTLLHYVAGLLLLLALNALSQGLLWAWASSVLSWVLTLEWYWIVLIALVAGGYGIIAGVWLLGELVHVTILFSLKRLIDLAEFVQRKYADGTVGILGFGLLLLGFILQVMGTYFGRPIEQ